MNKEKQIQELLDKKEDDGWNTLLIGVKMTPKEKPSYFYDINNYHKDGFDSMEKLMDDVINYLT